jgi:hypothetical protein
MTVSLHMPPGVTALLNLAKLTMRALAERASLGSSPLSCSQDHAAVALPTGLHRAVSATSFLAQRLGSNNLQYNGNSKSLTIASPSKEYACRT